MAVTLTPLFGLPCPDQNELVSDGANAISALALAVEAALNPAWVALGSLGTGYGARSGYLAPAYRVFGDGRVQFRGGLTKATAIVSTETVFTLPTDVRPSASVSVIIPVHRTGVSNSVAGKLDIATTGVATVHVIDSQTPVSIALDGVSFSRS